MQPKPAFMRLSEERKQELIEKAKDIYLTHPYEEITARMLLSAMELNPATFYRYFNSKDDLFIYIFFLICDVLESSVNDPTFQLRLDQPLDESEYLDKRDYNFVLLLTTVPENIVHRIFFDTEQYRNAYRQRIISEQKSGLIPEHLDTEFLSWYLLTNHYNAFIYFRRTHGSHSYNEFGHFIEYVLYDLVRYGYYKK